ncbi:hypothetical protein Mapa_002517 [Marchantia paleacea]|nr:hypothetical protein Mapa_002517 [Marchantia paleacea]
MLQEGDDNLQRTRLMIRKVDPVPIVHACNSSVPESQQHHQVDESKQDGQMEAGLRHLLLHGQSIQGLFMKTLVRHLVPFARC